MAEKEREKKVEWQAKVSQNLDYYLDTEQGRKELSEIIRSEAEALLHDVTERAQRVKDVIWLSSYCTTCTRFEDERGRMKCGKHDSRIVKPFYGKPIWAYARKVDGEKEMVISDVNWNLKAMNISDLVVAEAVKRINHGFPYSCFEPGD